ncbi:MAG: apolipoprotein N-acyltransferase [Rikenellaceae bacterium]
MSCQGLKNRGYNIQNLLLALLSIALLSLPWVEITSLTLFIAFVPLLMINKRSTHGAFIAFSIFILIAWHLITLIWVANATWIGPVAATVAGVTLFIIPLIFFSLSSRKSTPIISYVLLISSWTAAEYLYLNGEISFPWIMLGNGFSLDAKIVQWYEYTGSLGGTIWMLLSNILIFEAIERRSKKYGIVAGSVIVIPIIISFLIYINYKEEIRPLQVTIVQPNIDPYTEKFGSMTKYEQLSIIETLANEAPHDVDFIIAPETAVEGNIIEDDLTSSSELNRLKTSVISTHPQASIVTGVTAYRMYPFNIAEAPTASARKSPQGYYDVINGAVCISEADTIPLYIKSKLVIGVEMIPYPNILKHIPFFTVDLGGSVGGLLSQERREVFSNKGNKVGPAICFESIYGEHFGGFVREGAQVMFIVTNDGWWKDTFGYKQHFNFARIRAIETRRSIARSANTGISAFINQRGDVLERLGWDVRGTITDKINLNDKMTFYTIYGDWLGRISTLILVLTLLFLIAQKMKNKLNSKKI